MKPKQILTDLTLLEAQLNNFSFEELTMEEAAQLKKSFNSFKNRLEEKVHGIQSAPSIQLMDVETVDAHKVPDPLDNERMGVRDESVLLTLYHGLKTPINEILGIVDLIKEGDLDQEQLLRLEAMGAVGNQLSEILHELQEYIRLAAGTEKFETINFNLFPLIKDTLFLCNALIVHKEVRLMVDIDRRVPTFLMGDPSKLSQILLYLLGHTIKFVNEGDIHLQVGVKEDLGDSCSLYFQISHRGMGDVHKDRKHAYHSLILPDGPGYGKFLDNGLGLDIIKQLVQNLNGTIPVANPLGTGIAFSFNIPYKKGMGETWDNRYNMDYLDLAREGIKGMQLLVFEENPINQRVLKRCLEKLGCVVAVVDNRHAGLEHLYKHSVDMVLLDLQMKSMDGFRIVKNIRESLSADINSLPIIGLTTHCSPNDKIAAQRNGIGDLVSKPYDFDEILMLIYKNKKALGNMAHGPEIHYNENTPKYNKTYLGKIWQECSGEVDLLEDLIGLFKGNILEFIGKLKYYLPLGEFEKIQVAAQKVRASACLIHANSLLSIIDAIQTNCTTVRDTHYLNMLYDQFITAYPVLERSIDAELKALKIKGRP